MSNKYNNLKFTFVSAHIAHLIPNVHWIELYWEFIDNFGYLRSDLYGKHGVHLKKKGKNLMSEAIQRFQRKFMIRSIFLYR